MPGRIIRDGIGASGVKTLDGKQLKYPFFWNFRYRTVKATGMSLAALARRSIRNLEWP
jgi:hypothetical protein